MQKSCYHCGQSADNDWVEYEKKYFCCNGCKTVYEILSAKELGDFYALNKAPGVKPDQSANHQFEFLDTPEIFDRITQFSEDGVTVVLLEIPVMHCTSCIWLLEDLNAFNPNILHSTVNFTKKTVQISFNHNELALSELAKFLTSLGYKPSISLDTLNQQRNTTQSPLLYQLVVAGFCFGNIMLLAFPEYTDNNEPWLEANKNFFRFTMFLLSLPVFFYSAQDYFKSALVGLKNKTINIDLPIALGILALMLRSVYDVVFDLSPGYFDSLAGLVFFMLIGKWFQQKTYQSLAFDRDYQSFYPIAVTKINQNKKEVVLLNNLKIGDRILIRNQELIPADCVLMKGTANIDNSFITGEVRLIEKQVGDKIFAGGQHMGKAIELELIQEVNQSYLTSLWNNTAFNKTTTSFNQLTNQISKWFTMVILAIAVLASVFWYWYDSTQVLLIFTAILIVACPCALSLSAPFIFGNMMRIFGKQHLYLKNTAVIEKLSNIQHVVFDKTGTITQNSAAKINYQGKALTLAQKQQLVALCNNSNHPFSRLIVDFMNVEPAPFLHDFIEEKGKGLSGNIAGAIVKVGSAKFLNQPTENQTKESEVLVSINNEYLGKFMVKNQYRKGLDAVLNGLANYKLSVVSGDNAAQQRNLAKIFPNHASLLFNQSPTNKLNYIDNLQKNKQKVLMLGDGLNDAGALKQSDVGIAVTEDLNNFTPSSDAILDARSFALLPLFISLSKQSYQLVLVAFVISFLYNIVGLAFAVTGYLQPVVAAILMPISSISVVLFATLSTRFVAWRAFKSK